MLDVLRHRTFRRLFTAQIVALIGTGLLTVALGLLAYDLAGSDAGAVLGTALAIKMLAYVGVAPIISALTHRVPRKVLLVSADVIRALIALALPFVDQTWQIYVLIFLLQSASATFTPAFQSVIPSVLVEEEDYTRALSLSRLAYDLESLLSPILAAALLTLISYHSLFLGTVVGFTVSGLLVVGTTLPKLAPAGPAVPLVQRITLGARVMVGSPVLRGLLALNLVVASATGLVVVNTVVYVRDLLGGTNTGVALALGFYGGGSMPRCAVRTTNSRLDIYPATDAHRLRRGRPRTCRGVVDAPHCPDAPDLLGDADDHLDSPRGRNVHDQHPVGATASRRIDPGEPGNGIHRTVLPLPCRLPAHLPFGRMGRSGGQSVQPPRSH